MSTLLAGFGRADITPHIGARMVGYRVDSYSTGIHDRLLARALVLEDEQGRWGILSCELAYLNVDTVRRLRAVVYQRTGIPPARLFIGATHTHAGPHDSETQNWERPLAELAADAVEQACSALQPAHLDAGFGMLHGYSLNRRWLDRPVDPAVSVVRVDDETGRTLGLITVFGCHAVVLGYDNYLISGDWPGYASRQIEAHLRADGCEEPVHLRADGYPENLQNQPTCLFLQGGAGNINPLVSGVRRHLQSGHTTYALDHYYGPADDPQRRGIGDRGGGTFAEAEELGAAFAEEALRVARGLRPQPLTMSLWSEQLTVRAAADPGEPQATEPSLAPTVDNPAALQQQGIPAEVMVLGIGNALLVGLPGEVFAETAVTLRAVLRTRHIERPIVVSYANGWLSYLPAPDAFDEGGYEVARALGLGTSRQFQTRVELAIVSLLEQRAAAQG